MMVEAAMTSCAVENRGNEPQATLLRFIQRGARIDRSLKLEPNASSEHSRDACIKCNPHLCTLSTRSGITTSRSSCWGNVGVIPGQICVVAEASE
jgi:hypothetical protein